MEATQEVPTRTKPLKQVLICKCGAIYAACMEPECYSERDWQKDVRKAVKDGHKVKMVEDFKFEKCSCKELKQELIHKQIALFP